MPGGTVMCTVVSVFVVRGGAKGPRWIHVYYLTFGDSVLAIYWVPVWIAIGVRDLCFRDAVLYVAGSK